MEGSGKESGYLYAGALVLVAVVAVLSGGLLYAASAHVSSSGMSALRTRARYAADAGVEYALCNLENDQVLRANLLDNIGQSVHLAPGRLVNNLVPDVELVAVSREERVVPQGAMLKYGLWASDRSESAIWVSGADHQVVSAVHSNGGVLVEGIGHGVTGVVEHCAGVRTIGGGHADWVENAVVSEIQEDPPGIWTSQDLDPSNSGSWAFLARERGELFQIHGDWIYSDSSVPIPSGIYLVDGNVTISSAGVSGERVTIVATGQIDVSSTGLSFTSYVPGLTFMTTLTTDTDHSAFLLSGAGNMGGTVYAPNGRISVSGAGTQITGAFMGRWIDISGSGTRIYLAPVPVPASVVCGTFDVRSAAGDSMLSARVSDCGDYLDIVAWNES